VVVFAVAAEEPLEIRVNGSSLSVTMRTPGDDFELAAGFLVSEGVIGVPDEKWGERPLATVVVREGAEVGADELRDFLSRQRRHAFRQAIESCEQTVEPGALFGRERRILGQE